MLIVISFSVKVVGIFKPSSFLTIVYSLPATFTLIGSFSFTVAFIIYVLVLPFSAVTTTSILFNPSFTSISPVPFIDDFELVVSAFILIFSTLFSSSTEYSKVSLLNSGFNFWSSIDNDFKLLSESLFTLLFLLELLFELALVLVDCFTTFIEHGELLVVVSLSPVLLATFI